VTAAAAGKHLAETTDGTGSLGPSQIEQMVCRTRRERLRLLWYRLRLGTGAGYDASHWARKPRANLPVGPPPAGAAPGRDPRRVRPACDTSPQLARCDVSQKGSEALRDLRTCNYAAYALPVRSVILANLCMLKPWFSLPTRAELASFPSRSDFFDTKPEVTSRGSSSTYPRAAGSGA
jgi:hypothetical protein